MIRDFHIMMVKVVAMEAFPEKGWFGFVTMKESGPLFYGVFSRGSLYREVNKVLEVYPRLHMIAQCVSVKKGNKTIFVPYRDAKTPDDAARKIWEMLPSL
jgi:hypothetical protein